MIATRASLIAALMLPAGLAVSACGEEKSSSSTTTATQQAAAAKSQVALREIGETRDALRAAAATYAKGDRAAAEDQVAEAYVQHFEEVEGPLGERDAELNEQLEEAISQELRQEMKAGKPAAEVQKVVDRVVAELDKAETKLR